MSQEMVCHKSCMQKIAKCILKDYATKIAGILVAGDLSPSVTAA